MNVTVEMLAFLVSFAVMLGAGAGFLWKMKTEILGQMKRSRKSQSHSVSTWTSFASGLNRGKMCRK